MSEPKEESSHLAKRLKEPTLLAANWEIFRISMPAIASCLGVKVIEFFNVIYAARMGGDPSKVIVLTLANLLTDSFSLSTMMGLNWAL